MTSGAREVPLLRAGPLVLVAWRPGADVPDVLAMAADPESRRWSPSLFNVRTEAQAAEWLAGRVGPDRTDWAVRDADSHALVGRVSLHEIDEPQHSAEIGYAINPDWRRRGLARTAVTAALEHAFHGLGLFRVSLCHAVGNTASCAVASSCGFAFEGIERSALDHGDGVLHDLHRHARIATDPPGAAPGPTPIEPVELQAGSWLLRPPEPGDAAEALALVQDPEVAQWNPVPSVVDEATAARWLASGADWTGGDHATFSVVEPESGRSAGSVSLHRIDHEQAWAAIGYRVAPWARGRGAATAAVTSVTEWAFERLGLARVELCHAAANEGSCRVAVKAGYQLEGTLRQANVYGDGRRYDEHVHGRLAPGG